MNKNRALYKSTEKKAKNCIIALHKGHCSSSAGISNSGKLNQSVTYKLQHLIVKMFHMANYIKITAKIYTNFCLTLSNNIAAEQSILFISGAKCWI